MIALAWRMARARPASLAGSVVALALGVALLTVTALAVVSSVERGREQPRWFTRADVVIAGGNSARLTYDERVVATVRTTESRALPDDLPSRLRAVDAVATVDHASYAVADGAPGDTLHPWSAASLHAYTWESGTPPRGPGEIVLTAPTAYRPRDRIVVQTAAGPRRFTVSGVLRTTAPAAFYATDATATRLAAGRIDAIALTARPGVSPATLVAQVQAVVRDEPVRVLTGIRKREAEPDPEADLRTGAVVLLGNTAALAGFVSVFVVASTFAYAVVARRRELGLLRVTGATRRQVRRVVLGEALAVGIAGGGIGTVLGSVIAPPFAQWFARAGFAPSTFTASFVWWPAAAAFGTGVLIALLGAWLAARRASRVDPIETLSEAAVDRRAMTRSRWLGAAISITVAIPGFLLSATSGAGGASAGYFLLGALALIAGGAALAPVCIRPLARLLTAPLVAARGATGLLARDNVCARVRRATATAAPILLTVGLAGAAMAGTATLTATEQAAASARVAADAVIAGPVAGPTIAALRALPDVSAAVPVADGVVYVGDRNAPFEWTGRYVDGPDVSRVLRLPVVAGTLRDLTGTDTIAVPAGRWRLGDTATVALGDSTPVRLRVVAVFADHLDLSRTVLLPEALHRAHTARPLADTVYLRLEHDADLGAVQAVAADGGRTVAATREVVAAAADAGDRLSRLGLVATLGVSLIYTTVAIANTMVMATGGRMRDLGTLRLAGATTRQVLRVVGVEALLVSGAGVVLATIVTALALLVLRAGLLTRAPTVVVAVPWLAIGGVALICAVTALAASLVPAVVLLRRRPVELAGLRE